MKKGHWARGVLAVCLAVFWTGTGCSSLKTKKQAKADQEQQDKERQLLHQPLGRVDLVGRSEYVLVKVMDKNVGRSKMEADTYRSGEKTGRIRFTGEMKDGWAAADIVEGTPAAGDLAMRRDIPPLPDQTTGIEGMPVAIEDLSLLPELKPPPGEAYPGGLADPGLGLPPAAIGATTAAAPGLPPMADPGLPALQPPPGTEISFPEAPPPLEDWAKPNWQDDSMKR